MNDTTNTSEPNSSNAIAEPASHDVAPSIEPSIAPSIAIVGRPNVGKSTLFNRLTRTKSAIVSDFPGLTRDRQYGSSIFQGQSLIWIDTGGITAEEEGIDSLIVEQSMLAIEECDIVLFLVDAKQGLVPGDESIAAHLRRVEKKVMLVVNKVDGKQSELLTHDFYGLGLSEPVNIAAVHGIGVESLLEAVIENFSQISASSAQASVLESDEHVPSHSEFNDDSTGVAVTGAAIEVADSSAAESQASEAQEKRIKIAIVGRPNVGKSTLMNRMLKEERTLVYDMPGTTRDSIYVPFERYQQPYTLIDTAGMRRRGKIGAGVERFSVVKTLQAISDAHVVILVIDSSEGLVDQDLHLLGFILEAGKAGIIACNKWDGLETDQKNAVKSELDRRLEFANYLKIHRISALYGTGVGNLFESINRAYQAANTHVKTPRLTALLEQALIQHPPPLVRGRRIKLRYAHMGGVCPPRIVIHGNQTSEVPNAYRRYLQNYYRAALKIEGTPIHFEFKTGKNPYAGRVNKLNARQIQKKRRLMKHAKK